MWFYLRFTETWKCYYLYKNIEKIKTIIDDTQYNKKYRPNKPMRDPETAN